METPKEYYYTYYSYEEWGRGYFGSRGCECLPEEDTNYFGSSRDKTFKPTQKIILKDDYATREGALADEIVLQEHYRVVENPHFANKAYQTSTKFYYISSKEEATKGGEKAKELGVGIHALTPEQRSENGKKASERAKELGIGFYGLTKEQINENAKKGGKKTKELGVGIHALTPEQRSENGKNSKKLGKGIFALTPEQKMENAIKGGKVCGNLMKELGKGVCGLTKEQRIENGKKGGKIGGKIAAEKNRINGKGIFALTPEQRSQNSKKTASQKWMCLETGFIANAGNLAKYQKAKCIDSSMRIRVE
jgi:hypothetical protein